MSNKISSDWQRWVAKSIFKFLDEQLRIELNSFEAQLGNTFKIRTEDELETSHEDSQEWIEIRLDGPIFSPMPGEYSLFVEINLLLCSLRNEENIYRHRSLSGCISKVLSNSICISDDDDVEVGVLRTGRVVSSYLGEVSEAIVQSVFEVHGQTELGGI